MPEKLESQALKPPLERVETKVAADCDAAYTINLNQVEYTNVTVYFIIKPINF